jgi:hypothetical protein
MLKSCWGDTPEHSMNCTGEREREKETQHGQVVKDSDEKNFESSFWIFLHTDKSPSNHLLSCDFDSSSQMERVGNEFLL